MQKHLENAIDGLFEKYKIIFTLRGVEGMDNLTVAACLDISESNVKVHPHW